MLLNNINVNLYDMFEEEIEIEDMLNEEVEIVKIECTNEDNELTMNIYVKTRYCKYAHEYTEQTSEEFSDIVWAHGLSNKGKTADKAIMSIINNPNIERCCSHIDQLVGRVGVYVRGTVLLASNIDLMSMPTVDGHRGIDLALSGSKVKGIIYETKDIDTTIYSNGEIIMTNMEIVGIWTKDEPTNELIAIANELNMDITRI